MWVVGGGLILHGLDPFTRLSVTSSVCVQMDLGWFELWFVTPGKVAAGLLKQGALASAATVFACLTSYPPPPNNPSFT